MSGRMVVVVRPARPGDIAARETLLRQGYFSHNFDAFLYFFFQELTLQGVVLGGAVLFIFVGAPLWACAALVPLAALFVAISVYAAHAIAADNQLQKLRNERVGWVAEARGPLGALPPPGESLAIVDVSRRSADGDEFSVKPVHAQVVGTASVSELWGPRRGGWLHGVAVHTQWRRRGVGRALVGCAHAWAAAAGLEAIEAAASTVGGGGGRALLHACGWPLRHSYHRPLLGAALTLPMVQLGLDLPHA